MQKSDGQQLLSSSFSSSKYEYAVVEFTKEKGQIAVIPCIWIAKETAKESSCYWPPIRNSTKLNKAIISKIEPSYDWEIHSIKIVRKSRTYEKANEAATYYEKFSDIELYSMDDKPYLKRKNCFAVSSDSETDCEEMPLRKRANKKSLNMNSLSSPPAFPSSSQRGLFIETAQSSQINQKCSCNTELRGLMEKALTEIDVLKKNMSEMRQEQKHLSQKMLLDDTAFEEIKGFPLTSVEELLTLNTKIEDNAEFSKLVHFFGRIGGKDVNEVTRNIMKAFISNRLSLKINWVGGYGKQSMRDLKRVLLLIAAAVRQVPNTRGASVASVEEVIKRWLRSAVDRDGGRMNRKSKKIQNENQNDENE